MLPRSRVALVALSVYSCLGFLASRLLGVVVILLLYRLLPRSKQCLLPLRAMGAPVPGAQTLLVEQLPRRHLPGGPKGAGPLCQHGIPRSPGTQRPIGASIGEGMEQILGHQRPDVCPHLEHPCAPGEASLRSSVGFDPGSGRLAHAPTGHQCRVRRRGASRAVGVVTHPRGHAKGWRHGRRRRVVASGAGVSGLPGCRGAGGCAGNRVRWPTPRGPNWSPPFTLPLRGRAVGRACCALSGVGRASMRALHAGRAARVQRGSFVLTGARHASRELASTV